MIKLGNFTVVLDACVIYDSLLRDILLRLAEKELYQPIWSSVICEEVERNLLKKIAPEKASKLIKTINEVFPEAVIDSYSTLPEIKENDINQKDIHVLASAILAKAQVIVTNNLKDFPNEVLNKYNIEAQSPDIFLTNLFYLSFKGVLNSYEEMEHNLKTPHLSREELLKRLEMRVPQFTSLLRPHLAENIIRIY